MSLIDTTYFINDLSIPTSSLSNLGNNITRYEPEILKRLLGYELYQLLTTDSSQRITDLIDGVEYTVSYNGRDQKVKWNGLKNSELISLIAYYVYYQWQRNNQTHTSKLGETKPKAENAHAISGGVKASAAWYKMRELYGYPEQGILTPSAYNFLLEHEDDYPELVFTNIGMVNSFGI